jgi:NAD(P)-dependent dehydrogenase (short-subunit alcohol dehydrogenase family)
VVNDAGILRDGIFHRMSTDDWLAVISMHLNGSFFVSRADGWTPETIAQHAIPTMQAAFMPLDTSEQAFPWDPV